MIDRKFITNFDWPLLGLTCFLAIIGVLNLYSAGYSTADSTHNTVYLRQLYWLGLSAIIMVIVLSFDYRRMIGWAPHIYAGSMIALIAVSLMGKTVSGSQRWLDIGILTFQPSEVAKLATVIMLASYFYRKDIKKGYRLRDLLAPAGIVLLPFILIAREPDLGTSLLLLFIFGSMALFIGIKRGAVLTLLGFGLTSIPLVWSSLKVYQKKRLLSFIYPEKDPLGSGYHALQSRIAVGSGKILGKGYLEGSQSKLNFLPEQHTDFAFSVLAEEWGFMGSILLIALYLSLILLGLHVAMRSKEKFGTFLAFGIVVTIFWQLVINVGMNLGLMPVVGIPLPLISYGGSSTITTLTGIGLLLNIQMRRLMLQKGP